MTPLLFTAQVDWEAWLEEHHASAREAWLQFAKKNSGAASISYAEAVEGALCFGWIDGQSKGLDETWWMQRFTPRRKRSKWSAINRDKVTELAREGRLRPAGIREVEAAKQDGRWDQAYASSKSMTVPEDLQLQLDAHPEARSFFDGLDATNRFAILYRIHDAKKPETRARRIEKFVAMLMAREKIY